MIVYMVQLLEIPAEKCARLMGAFREGGLWYELSKSLPGHIHTDILQSPASSSKFLSIEFWTSIDACLAAQSRSELKTFLTWLCSTTREIENLGVFKFPSRPTDRFPVAEGTVPTSHLPKKE